MLSNNLPKDADSRLGTFASNAIRSRANHGKYYNGLFLLDHYIDKCKAKGTLRGFLIAVIQVHRALGAVPIDIDEQGLMELGKKIHIYQPHECHLDTLSRVSTEVLLSDSSTSAHRSYGIDYTSDAKKQHRSPTRLATGTYVRQDTSAAIKSSRSSNGCDRCQCTMNRDILNGPIAG